MDKHHVLRFAGGRPIPILEDSAGDLYPATVFFFANGDSFQGPIAVPSLAGETVKLA